MSYLSEPDRDQQIQGSEPAEMPRRTFLRYLAGSVAAFIGILVGAPAIGYVAAPLRRKGTQGEWINLGAVERFAGGKPTKVQFSVSRQDGWVESSEGRTCWVVLNESNAVTVFNGHCTHLGCAYSWTAEGEDAGSFRCPCHDGVFDREGRVAGGPPPRPLDRLEAKVENGKLTVFFEDFRLGVSQRIPL